MIVPLVLKALFAVASPFLIIKLRKMVIKITKENPHATYHETYCVFSLWLLKALEKLAYVNFAVLLAEIIMMTIQVSDFLSNHDNCRMVSIYPYLVVLSIGHVWANIYNTIVFLILISEWLSILFVMVV